MRRWWRRRRRTRGDGLDKLDKPLAQRDPYLAAIERVVTGRQIARRRIDGRGPG